MNKSFFLPLLFVIIALACTTEENIVVPKQLNSVIEEPSIEKLPYFELTTTDGKITSDQFLVDSKPEFLLFISPN
ncbi:MAG: hypothetical protein FI704_01505 [SAR202 cluster bacterium]|nr:hypothetical protein [SAR202 cluster bacterium]MQG65734.1 hypothetical protein [SAR202 cluster bacterium]